MPCRSIQRMIEDQVHRWEALGETHARAYISEQVITISRLPGCKGRSIARELSQRMGFELFDKALLDKIAERTHMSAELVSTLDERVFPLVVELIDSFICQRYNSEDYFRHLSQTLLAIAKRGRAVILGRGANFILPPKTCLRVLLVAPLPARIHGLSRYLGLGLDETRRLVIEAESCRRAFVWKHFHRDMTDPTAYDLVLNTEESAVPDMVEAIRMSWGMKCESCSRQMTAVRTAA